MARAGQGDPTPLEQAEERTWTPREGWKTNRVWIGDTAAITSLAAQLQTESGGNLTMTIAPQDGSVSTLTVSFDDLQDGETTTATSAGEQEAESDTWTLQGNDYEKDLWSHPTVTDLATSCATEYNWLRKNLEVVRKNGTWEDVLAAYTATGDCHDKVRTIFKLFRDGTEAYSISQFVLRRSRTVKSKAEGSISVSNVGKQFTLAQLQSVEGVPGTLKFAMPSDGAWVKRTPTVNYDGNKMTVENEYWHADFWTHILYPYYT